MRHETTRELFRYWNEVRRERSSPERDEIDPTAIRHVLADTFLLEKRPDGSFPVRVSGTRADQKGRCFLDFWAEDRHSVAAALWAAMDGVNPVVLGAKAAPAGRPGIGVEVLLLPLRHHGKTHSLVLGALSLVEPPSWIGLVPIERLRLVSMRVLTSVETIENPPAPRWTVTPSNAAVERRAHLTVYAGGR